MRFSPLPLRAAFLLFAASGALFPSQAQTFPAVRNATPVLTGTVPDRVPSSLPAHHRKTDAPLMYARIRDGVYSVDGMVGKVRLNYDVKAANYLYLFMPGVGTALVSLSPSADGVSVPVTYQEGELTMRVAEHTFNLTGIESLVNDRGKEPTALFVTLNRTAWKLARTPMVGFGTAFEAPYQWPGVLPPSAVTAGVEIPSLPVPATLVPRAEQPAEQHAIHPTTAMSLSPASGGAGQN